MEVEKIKRAIFHFVTLTVLMINISNSNNILEGKSIPLGIKTKKNFMNFTYGYR